MPHDIAVWRKGAGRHVDMPIVTSILSLNALTIAGSSFSSMASTMEASSILAVAMSSAPAFAATAFASGAAGVDG